MSGFGSDNLRKANQQKNDEFYTQLVDIENELQHYTNHFKGKVVYCNCDDPYESNFFKYFAMNFNFLKLKKLIVTGYSTSSIAYRELGGLFDVDKPKAYKIELNEMYDVNKDGCEDLLDVQYFLEKGGSKNKIEPLQGDGDFRSEESVKLLKEADIVVTNPPFSLFREYISQLVTNKKQFLIIGNKNAISCKEIFPLIKNNQMWIGYTIPKNFILPGGEITTKQNGLTRRFTNLDIKKRSEDLILYKKYNQEEYSKYDNYDAININKVLEIPLDYDGIMGVPITFIDNYNPRQFEILGLERYTAPKEVLLGGRLTVNGKPTYARILIRHKK